MTFTDPKMFSSDLSSAVFRPLQLKINAKFDVIFEGPLERFWLTLGVFWVPGVPDGYSPIF